MNRTCANCGYSGEGFTRGKLVVITGEGEKIYETICPRCKRHYSKNRGLAGI